MGAGNVLNTVIVYMDMDMDMDMGSRLSAGELIASVVLLVVNPVVVQRTIFLGSFRDACRVVVGMA